MGDFFKNTYITGSGRTNYLNIKYLEDPLFTSFTFDIDFNTSPLFYTIYDYENDHINVGGLAERIELALDEMHCNMEKNDQGYDILPLMSASFSEDGRKLGFGIQQNVYLDQPLYGATEYIYMVDKRNGGADQNDVRYGNGGSTSNGGSTFNSNVSSNSYKLGDSVKDIVNESDAAWAERQMDQNGAIVEESEKILNDPNIQSEHEKNKDVYDNAKFVFENTKVSVNGEEYSETELENQIKTLKFYLDGFDKLKKDIVDWANSKLSQYQKEGTNIYNGNKCVQYIYSKDNIGTTEIEQIKSKYGFDFVTTHLYSNENSYDTKFINLYDTISQELLDNKDTYLSKIKDDKIINKFRTELEEFGLIVNDNTLKGEVIVNVDDITIDWVTKTSTHLGEFGIPNINDLHDKIQKIMSYKCDVNYSFSGDFISENIEKNKTLLDEFETGLSNIKFNLYGSYSDGDGFDKYNPAPDSVYGQYMEAKENYENDEYSQAENALSMSLSGVNEMGNMLKEYDDVVNNNSNDSENVQTETKIQDLNNITTEQLSTPQTVLDMLGFISGMKKMTQTYPYIIQGITGLDTAYNKHYVIKDPYLGSGEDKITLTCLESIDLRVSSMFNRYFNAVYDRQYRRERVPINLRRFNCSVYVHDVRNFNPNSTSNGNRIIELKDMYYSVIEFKFYDCEIVPEETGNIFNDISNEAPLEMKKTNFTFTYSNCVVNFIPA